MAHGVIRLASICWMASAAMATNIPFCGSSRNATIVAVSPPSQGPNRGMNSTSPFSTPSATALGTPMARNAAVLSTATASMAVPVPLAHPISRSPSS